MKLRSNVEMKYADFRDTGFTKYLCLYETGGPIQCRNCESILPFTYHFWVLPIIKDIFFRVPSLGYKQEFNFLSTYVHKKWKKEKKV